MEGVHIKDGFRLLELTSGSVELHDARRKRRWHVSIAAFELAEVPVTESQYSNMLGFDQQSDSKRPATSVSWLDAVRFCNLASAQVGLSLAYEIADDSVVWLTDATGYRLPTEAEWEFACRAGTSGPHYGPLDEIAWTSQSATNEPQSVGLKTPNDFGLFDMLGNVWEWCWDFLDPARYDDYRVFRGGGFADEAWSVRASTRRGGAPTMHHPDLGFRLARGAFPPDVAVQGWSAREDAERSAVSCALPMGWTPRR